MSDPRALELLGALVDAHEVPDPQSGQREAILLMRYAGGAFMRHHALRDSEPPAFDDALLDELIYAGLLNRDYVGEHTDGLTPTAEGRRIIARHRRIMGTEPQADVGGVLAALVQQDAAPSKLAWPAVRPVLLALRQYWEAAGFPPHGIQLMPFVEAVPDEHGDLFVATIRALVAGDYLRSTSELGLSIEIPAEVVITERTHAIVDGWPGAEPQDLVENLLAVLAAEAAATPDEARKRKLAKVAETVRELGVGLASDVLAKVLTGGV